MSVTINASTSAGAVITSDTSGSLQLQTNSGTTAVTVDTSQNVGIGTTSPTAKLHTQIGAGATAGLKALNANGGGLQFYTDTTGANADVFIESPKTGVALAFLNGGSERMRLSAAGELLWGCTATSGSVPTTSGIAFSATASAYDNVLYFRNGADPTYVLDFYNTAGSRAGKVTVNASTTSYDTSSDYRLKENIAPMSNALATVALLKPVTYTWKATGEAGQGFIAHELQEILPDAVTGEKDGVDKNGNPDYQGVDASFLVATLTAAIQELKVELDATKAEIAALKGTV